MKTTKKQNCFRNSTENMRCGSKMFISDVNFSQGKSTKSYPGTETVSSLLFDECGKFNKSLITNSGTYFTIDLKDYAMK